MSSLKVAAGILVEAHSTKGNYWEWRLIRLDLGGHDNSGDFARMVNILIKMRIS